ncbi:transposase [Duganella qianjiadongensis]|uniref:Transposase n=1 Tax=Duganella qianjiadongensis TaxID=2692176 RepID=A0ABW9VG52_9BURK|nr:transposase [Duganella qianjiadongensis]MYM38450.1 transposase [Duganella qianjiadongensis]
MSDDYDTPWKEVLVRYLPDFMAFYFPRAHAAIDWSRPYSFLDQELAALSAGAALGRRVLDKLVRVFCADGSAQTLLLHVELQGWRDGAFAERMFIYHYRVYDRYRQPVASMALLLDDGWHWRPACYAYQVLDCRLQLDFPVVKLRDFEAQLAQLYDDPNPFGLVTLAHLQARRTRRNAYQRRHAKWRLTKLLLRRDWDRQRIIDLYRTIDWLLRLPDAMESRVRRGIYLIREETEMAYLSYLERYGLEQGLQQGLQQGQATQLLDMLELRFGTLSAAVRQHVAAAEVPQLQRWARNFVHAERLEQVFSAE